MSISNIFEFSVSLIIECHFVHRVLFVVWFYRLIIFNEHLINHSDLIFNNPLYYMVFILRELILENFTAQ